jgi:hypothetical protein
MLRQSSSFKLRFTSLSPKTVAAVSLGIAADAARFVARRFRASSKTD